MASRASATSRLDAVGPMTRIRTSENSARSSSALGNRRDAERAGALVDERAGDVDRAVAVGVGLDDRPELRALEHAQQRPRVPPDRAEVDGDLRPVHPRLPRRPRWTLLSQSSKSGSTNTVRPFSSSSSPFASSERTA